MVQKNLPAITNIDPPISFYITNMDSDGKKMNEKNWFVDHLVGDKIITYISRQLSYKKKGEKKETTRFYFYNLHGINYTTRSRIWDSFIGVNGGKKVCRKYMIIQQRF